VSEKRVSDEEELREILAELEREGVICPSSRLDVAMKRLLQRKGRDEVRRKSAPLVRALNDAGLEVESVWDLIGREYDFDSIIPVLLDHLEKPYPRVTREGILRALDVKGTGPLITKRLIELFRLEQDPEIKILTGSVLANFGDPAEIDDMVKLLQDRSHGGAAHLSSTGGGADSQEGCDPDPDACGSRKLVHIDFLEGFRVIGRM
jgi:hypothetical protein